MTISQFTSVLRDNAQNTTNSAISLVVYNVIPILIGWSRWAPIYSIMYYVGQGTRPCPFPVTGNGHGRVTEPKGDHFSGRNLGMLPRELFRSLSSPVLWTRKWLFPFLENLDHKIFIQYSYNILRKLFWFIILIIGIIPVGRSTNYNR